MSKVIEVFVYKTKITLSGLAGNREYFVRVRTYKNIKDL